MSEVTRHRPWGDSVPTEFVLASDYDQLKAELDRLRDVQILLNTERALVEQLEERLAEVRELLRYSADECIPSLGREIEDWLGANKV